MEQFGKFIKEKRKLKMTQREFAELLGVGAPYISKLENGIEKTPSDTLLYKMADILGLDEALLFQKIGRIPKELQKNLLKDDKRALKLFNCSDSESLKSGIEREDTQKIKTFLNTDNIILIIDPITGEIVDASESAIKFYDYTLKELKSKRIIDLNTLPEEIVRKKMKEAALTQQNIFNFKHRSKFGTIKNVQVFSTPFSIRKKKYLFSTIMETQQRKHC